MRPDGTDLVLRPAAEADASVLADLFIAARRAAEPAMPPPVHPATEIHAWFGQQLAAGREVWVAEHDEGVVGYLIIDDEWLDSLYVRPDLTGHGIGSLLMDLAKGLRPDGFGLWVFETNVDAQRFYARHGFVVAERTDGSDNEEGAPDLRMVWGGALADLRQKVDDVDGRLARLLEERAELTAEIQRWKVVPGEAGRDRSREAEIAERMGSLAPRLGPARMAKIMDVVIAASLDAADPP